MSFTKDKKEEIKFYILKLIDKHERYFVSKVVQNFNISNNTVYRYIKDLENEKKIKRIKRGEYELVNIGYKFIDIKADENNSLREEKIYEKNLKTFFDEYKENVRDIWEYAFSEIMNNVLDHSGFTEAHVVVWKNALDTKMLISDDGVGIFKKIKDYFNLDSLDDAVDELFKGKITTDNKNHSGQGIFFTSRIMDDFWISSDHKLFSHNKYNTDFKFELESNNFNVYNKDERGTEVIMILSNNSKKTIKGIFDEFSDIDNGLSKTNIKIKNIFERSPVSRSQANRLCFGLDRFKNVIIDFEGVNWIGQAFADQLFRVFKNAHPELIVTPINANENVKKMINHVLKSNI